MTSRPLARFVTGVFIALLGVVPVSAQQATPIAETTLVPIPVASALTNPRGFTWGADGTLYVALAGSGGTTPATETAPTTNAIGPFMGGTTGAVASIDASGCPVAVTTGLPSTITAMGDVLGADDVAVLKGELYAGVDGGGAVHGDGTLPSGVYRLLADGSFKVVADLSAWVRANPVANIPGDSDPDAAGYSLVADEAAGVLWVGDPNSGQILSVTPDGTVARIADISEGHHVLTRLVADPAGGVYVGTLTAAPFPDGGAKVMHVAADGTVKDVWTGLTVVTDVAVDADGTLYALEMSTGNTAAPPFLIPGSGQVVMQTGPDSSTVVAGGLMFPIAMEIGPDGSFYVATPAIGANGGDGMIVRLGDASSTPMAASACAPIPETLTAAPASTPAASTPAAATAKVDIANFAFAPQSLEITAGTTVTFTNSDTTAHTATADDGSFDTGTIDPGTSAEVTFDTPGTYTYKCNFHPSMTGTIIVS